MLREIEMTVQYISLLAASSTLISWAINILQIGSTSYIHRCHFIVNPLLEVTTWRFWWRWEQLHPNTLREIVMVIKINYVTKLTWLLQYLLTFIKFTFLFSSCFGHVALMGNAHPQYLLWYVSYSQLI